jgi:hypothetical protein
LKLVCSENIAVRVHLSIRGIAPMQKLWMKEEMSHESEFWKLESESLWPEPLEECFDKVAAAEAGAKHLTFHSVYDCLEQGGAPAKTSYRPDGGGRGVSP